MVIHTLAIFHEHSSLLIILTSTVCKAEVKKWCRDKQFPSHLKAGPHLCSMAEAHGQLLPKRFQGQTPEALLWQSTSCFVTLHHLTKPSLSKVSCCIRYNSLPKRGRCDETSEGKKSMSARKPCNFNPPHAVSLKNKRWNGSSGKNHSGLANNLRAA